MNGGGIDVDHLRKTFGKKVALDDVSFSVEPGSMVGLLGRNGAGKTTVINCLSTLLPPDGGRATVAGHDVVSDPVGVRASIALTGQFAAVDEVLTGRQNLVLFGRLLKLSKKAAHARAEELLSGFGLTEAADDPVGSYSGGMRRRLDLAASLVVERPVIFLDEPTTGLDPAGRREVWDVVSGLRSGGTTILLTTQYLEEADRLADRIVVVEGGVVIAEGTPRELKDQVGGTVCAVHIESATEREKALGALRGAMDGSMDGIAEHDGVITVPGATVRTVAEVARILDDAGVEPDDVALRRPTLDDVFFALTGTAPGGTGDGGAADGGTVNDGAADDGAADGDAGSGPGGSDGSGNRDAGSRSGDGGPARVGESGPARQGARP
ncbi:ATP-binding cassette domain-containing protein [Streptosporangium sp. NPDC023963]|uniref:ATP-binding cassette domain-containing protein n=1 Tax=Streptosporangium sp. NPDC023963 TaxID=3155608 RepID=UPI003438B745